MVRWYRCRGGCLRNIRGPFQRESPCLSKEYRHPRWASVQFSARVCGSKTSVRVVQVVPMGRCRIVVLERCRIYERFVSLGQRYVSWIKEAACPWEGKPMARITRCESYMSLSSIMRDVSIEFIDHLKEAIILKPKLS